MDWDLKLPLWDMGELEQNATPNMGSVVQSNGGLGRQAGSLDCSVDLKLGGLGDFGSSDKWRENPRAVPTMAGSSSKRARAPSSGGQNVSCLVDGCKADLSNCREYHRRHKVCEVHSKTPIVMVGSQEQRFCQQCSRFHLLVEFDEVKRSCRKRLDGHNRRRRKPQPESINSGSFFPNHQGSRFSYPQVFQSATFEPSWASIVKTEEDAFYSRHSLMHFFNKQHNFPGSSRSYKEGKQFPFLHVGSDVDLSSRMTPEPPVCQPLHKTLTPVESSSSRMFSGGLTQVLSSDRALSLLSSPTQTSGINLGQTVQADRIPMGQPLVTSLQYSGLCRYSQSQSSNNLSTSGFSCSGIEDDHAGEVLVSNASNTNIHCQDIFHVAGEGSSDRHTQALPFSWQ